jgi:uncharacterized protein (DUF302 family)
VNLLARSSQNFEEVFEELEKASEKTGLKTKYMQEIK